MTPLLPEFRAQLYGAARRREHRRIVRLPNLALGPRPAALAARLPLLLSAVVAVAIAAVVLLTVHTHKPAPVAPAARVEVPSSVRQLATQLAVLRRPQTAKDRTLPSLLQRVIRLTGFGPIAKHVLDGTIPGLTRYIETLPDSREVLLVVYRPNAHFPPPPARANHEAREPADIGLVILQPDGKPEDGGAEAPIAAGNGGATAHILYHFARYGPSGSSIYTHYNIVPDRVARIRWQFSRQDSYGYVYKTPLTVNIPVVQNVAIAVITSRRPSDSPTVVTLYNARGQVISETGNPADLDRITRPVRHGNPFAGLRGRG